MISNSTTTAATNYASTLAHWQLSSRHTAAYSLNCNKSAIAGSYGDTRRFSNYCNVFLLYNGAASFTKWHANNFANFVLAGSIFQIDWQ